MSNPPESSGLTPPRIEPVAPGASRPLWSVMIPTFNCAKYLRQTLASVLAQAPGPEQMQIEVVDDCSTKDDPEAVVRELGQGRVMFYRKPKNEGAIPNFNTCIARSRGQLVHILHGDDVVLPGFYQRIAAVSAAQPEMAMVASRSFLIDEENVVIGVSDRVPRLESGGNAVDDFFYGTPTQTPGVVMRRSFYEKHGGFLTALVHTADCEMWTRGISLGGAVLLPDVLCNYRVFAANDSGRLARTAENLRDLERLHGLFVQRHPGFNLARATARIAYLSQLQVERFRQKGDAEAVAANLAFWKQRVPLKFRLRYGVLRRAKNLLG
jgi:glycosyltransferase involved in cell wall biosynthesis